MGRGCGDRGRRLWWILGIVLVLVLVLVVAGVVAGAMMVRRKKREEEKGGEENADGSDKDNPGVSRKGVYGGETGCGCGGRARDDVLQ